MGYIKENGKTFWQSENGELERAHDDNFSGMRFRHRRCPLCNKITSMHVLHWLNHTEKCFKGIDIDNESLASLRYGNPIEYVLRNYTDGDNILTQYYKKKATLLQVRT